jgi:DNA mismatch repair protein MutS
MMQVKDLKLKEEVLPCFDYTNSEQAALRLLYLLQEIPSTETEVLERQGITKGIIGNWSVLESFTYRRLDLMEVHDFFESITANSTPPVEGKIRASLKLMLNEADRNQLRSRLVQTVLLLRGINVQYLSRIDKGAFPASFQAQLQQALSFLNKLNLETFSDHINEDRFTVTRMVELSYRIKALNPVEVKAFWHFFFTFEAFWSIAKGTTVSGFTFPTFDTTAINVEEFYHPSLKDPVKNTLRMKKEQNVLLLTGPNMSGKSTLLKAVGLCVYLARAGFTVPATVCSVPFFSSIAVAVNLNDSLQEGYSHFMAEIQNLKAVVQATEGEGKCFAVFDEIFKGTNTDDALQLTQTTVDGLIRRKGSFFFISTHMLQLDEQLSNDKSKEIKKCYIECVLDREYPKFSYRLKEGWSQLKIGKILFEKEGLTELLESKKEEWQHPTMPIS